MDLFARMPEGDRRDILQEAANRRDLQTVILEKDFWVCWTLKRLFLNADLSPFLTFKGGTSLSKAYGLIDRFSEDIDLTISREAVGITDDNSPMAEGISSNECNRRIARLKQGAQRFVADRVLPALAKDIDIALRGIGGWELVLDEDDRDQQTILFHYPKVFNYNHGSTFGNFVFGTSTFGASEYIKSQIKLEFGARGEAEPSEVRSIRSYVAEDFPEILKEPTVEVATLRTERTFWEKATILHALHHGSKLKDRMSRHYYDIYQLAQRGAAESALQDVALLEQVVRNKNRLFRDGKASYATACVGTLRLVPTEAVRAALEPDYEKMGEMVMGPLPPFDSVMAALDDLEARINTL